MESGHAAVRIDGHGTGVHVGVFIIVGAFLIAGPSFAVFVAVAADPALVVLVLCGMLIAASVIGEWVFLQGYSFRVVGTLPIEFTNGILTCYAGVSSFLRRRPSVITEAQVKEMTYVYNELEEVEGIFLTTKTGRTYTLGARQPSEQRALAEALRRGWPTVRLVRE